MVCVRVRVCLRKGTREEDMAFILEESAVLTDFHRAGADYGAFRQGCIILLLLSFFLAISRILWIHTGICPPLI